MAKPGRTPPAQGNRAQPLRPASSGLNWLAATVIVLLGFWIYAPSMHGAWLWDDQTFVAGNADLRDSAGLWNIWFAPGQVDYFPLTNTVQWALWHGGSGDTFAFHFVNVVLHVGSGLLLWILLSQLGVKRAWIGGLLWVVHPLAVESVAWIEELKNTLSQFLLMFSIVSYLAWRAARDRKNPPMAAAESFFRSSRAYYLGSWLLFVAAMLSKSSVVMLPVVMLLYFWWKDQRLTWREIKTTIPFFAAAFVLGLITVWFQHHRGIGGEYVDAGGFATRLARAGLALGFYLSKCLLPVNLMLVYPRWAVDPPALLQFLPWPLLAVALAWLWIKRKTWGRHVLLGFGFFAINLLPVLGFMTMAYMWITWTADHFAYLSLVGVVGLEAAGISWAWTRWPQWRPYLAGGVALVVALLAFEAHNYAGAFRDQETLFTRAVESNPDAWQAQRSLAQILQQTGRNTEAAQHFAAAQGVQEKAIQFNPADAVAHFQLGTLLEDQGKMGDASAQFQEALRLKPDYVAAHGNLGYIFFVAGHIPEAKDQFLAALQQGPDSAEIRYNLGYVDYIQQNYAEALPNLEQAVRLKPDYLEAHYSLAQTLQKLGRTADALQEYETTLRLQPNNPALRQLIETLQHDSTMAPPTPTANSP